MAEHHDSNGGDLLRAPLKAERRLSQKGGESVAVPSIQLGQLWRADDTSDNWLVTKTYSGLFSNYVVLRKVGSSEAEVRRVKIEKTGQGVTLPGFTFSQETESF